MFLAPFVVIFAAIVGYLIYKNYKLDYQRSGLLAKYRNEAPELRHQASNVSHLYQDLSDEDQKKLFEKAIVFLYEKKWSEAFDRNKKACESIKACLPLLYRDSNLYPSLERIEKERTLREWLKFHERQFEFEQGKMALLGLRAEFVEIAEKFFTHPEELSEQHHKALEAYFRP